MAKRNVQTMVALVAAIVFIAVIYLVYTGKWCISTSPSDEGYSGCAPPYGNQPAPGSFPSDVHIQELRKLAASNPAGQFLFNVLMGNGNNGNPGLPQFGLLFCVYTPRMFTGCEDVRPHLAHMTLTSDRAKALMSKLLRAMNNLANFYYQNGISDPCNRMNLFVQHVQPIRNFIAQISSSLADLIPMTVTGEVAQ